MYIKNKKSFEFNYKNSKELSWVQVLSILNIIPQSAVLPCKIPCPIKSRQGDTCRGTLTIYADISAGGTHSVCDTCEFSGGILSVAGGCWGGMDLRATLDKLLRNGLELGAMFLLEDNIIAHTVGFAEKDLEFKRFWDMCKEQMLSVTTPDLRNIKRRHRLEINMDKDRWINGPGLFIGVATREQYVQIFNNPPEKHTRTFMRGTHDRPPLESERWEEVLVFPSYDLPKRIKGFYFLGRNGKLPSDLIFKKRQFGFEGHGNTRINNGLTNYETLTRSYGPVIIMNSPLLATKMLIWHAQDHDSTPALLSLVSEDVLKTEIFVWDQIEREKVFWGWPDAEILRHAKHTNSKISTVGFTEDGPIKTFNKIPLTEWMNRIEYTAKPWDVVLKDILGQLNTVQTEELFINMRLSYDEISSLLGYCKAPVTTSMMTNPEEARSSVIDLAGKQIKEYNGWTDITRKRELINAILRIEKIVCNPIKDETYYAGHILFKGKKVPFYELSSKIDGDTGNWMRKHLLRNKAGILAFDRARSSQFVTIALKFHEPDVVMTLTRMGWDVDECCFVFPKFVIEKDGSVNTERVITPIPRKLPALVVQKPFPLSNDHLSYFNNEKSDYAVEVINAVLTNMLSYVYSYDPYVIGVHDSDNTGVNIAKGVGCAEYAVPKDFMHTEETLSEICATHNWPLVLRKPNWNVKYWIEWLESNSFKNCIVNVNRSTLLSCRHKKNWIMLVKDEDNYLPPPDELLARIISLFLQHLTTQRFALSNQTAGLDWPQRIIKEFAKWLIDQGCERDVSKAIIEKQSNITETCLQSFSNIVYSFIESGDLKTIRRAGFIRTSAKSDITGIIYFSAVKDKEAYYFIPKILVNNLLRVNEAPKVDEYLDEALLTIGGGKDVYRGIAGWILPEKYWDRIVMENRKNEKHKLKLKI